MTKSVTKVIYKPDPQSTEEFIVIVADPAEYKKWKAGDTTIPLIQIVDSFTVYYSSQGAQGVLGRPSKQQLENIFGSSNDDDVVRTILRDGREQKGELAGHAGASLNASRGQNNDNRSAGTSF